MAVSRVRVSGFALRVFRFTVEGSVLPPSGPLATLQQLWKYAKEYEGWHDMSTEVQFPRVPISRRYPVMEACASLISHYKLLATWQIVKERRDPITTSWPGTHAQFCAIASEH